ARKIRVLLSSPGGGVGSCGMRSSRSQNSRKELYIAGTRQILGRRSGMMAFEQLACAPQFIPDAEQQGNHFGIAGGRRSNSQKRCCRLRIGCRMRLVPSHPRVKEIADSFVFFEPFDHELWPSRS